MNLACWIDFGGQRNYPTALHEIAHTLGVGTAPNFGNFISNGVWTGANGVQQIHAIAARSLAVSFNTN